MNKILLLASFILLSFINVSAQRYFQHRPRHPQRHVQEVKQLDPAIDSLFMSGKFEKGTIIFPYRFTFISPEQEGKKILVIYLHGRSASGTDNKHQLTKDGVKSLLNYLKINNIKSTLLVPQCPPNHKWNEHANDGTQMTANIKKLIDEFIALGEYDPQCIYIFGDSMGGTGVWRMLNDYTSLFAAAMSVASVPRKVKAKNISKTPIYIVIGENDNMASEDIINPFVQKINKKNSINCFDILENSNHQQTCDSAFTTERIKWVLNHKKL